MEIQKVFDIGGIMEPEDKPADLVDLSWDDCVIVSKGFNKNKVILHMKRDSDGTEGNVFVRLNQEHLKDFNTSRKLLGSKNIMGLTLNQFKVMDIEKL